MPHVESPPLPTSVGFLAGALAPWRGLAFVMQTPATWGYALVPGTVFLALAVGLGALGIGGVQHFLQSLLGAPASTWGVVLGWVLRVLLWVAAALLAVVVALALAQPLSGPALEAISKKQELALGGVAHQSDSALTNLFRSLRVTLSALAVTLAALIVLTIVDVVAPPATIVTVPLKFVISGLMLSWDLLDYPLSVRNAGVRARLAWFGAHFWAALGFGLSLAVLFLVPCAGLLLLPAGAAGATRLVVEADEVERARLASGATGWNARLR